MPKGTGNDSRTASVGSVYPTRTRQEKPTHADATTVTNIPTNISEGSDEQQKTVPATASSTNSTQPTQTRQGSSNTTAVPKKKLKTDSKTRGFPNDCAECAIEAAVEHLGLGKIRFDYVMTDIEGDQVDISPSFFNKDGGVEGQHWFDRREVGNNLKKLDRTATYILRTGVAGENGGGHWQILYFNSDLGWGLSNGAGHFEQLTDVNSVMSAKGIDMLSLNSQDDWGQNPSNMRNGKPALGTPAQRSIYIVQASSEMLMAASHFLAAYRNTSSDPSKPDIKDANAIAAVEAFNQLKPEKKRFHEFANFVPAKNKNEQEEDVEKEEEHHQQKPPVKVETKAEPEPVVSSSVKEARWGANTSNLANSTQDFVSRKAAFADYLKTKDTKIKGKYASARSWAESTGSTVEPTDPAVVKALKDIQEKAKVHVALEAQKMDRATFSADMPSEIAEARKKGQRVVIMTTVVKPDHELVQVQDDPEDAVFENIDEMNNAINAAMKNEKLTIGTQQYTIISKKKDSTNVKFHKQDAAGKESPITPKDLEDFRTAAQAKNAPVTCLSEAVMNKTAAFVNGKMELNAYAHAVVREDTAYKTKHRP